MSISKIVFTFLIALVFTSCQKGISNNDPATQVSNKIKTYTEDVTSGGVHNVITFNLGYDAGNRLISIISAASAGDRFEYQYSTGSYILNLYNSNKLSIHEAFYLNSNSMVDSTFQYNDTNDSSTEKYLYNSAKQLTAIKQYIYSLAGGSVLDNIENYEYDSNGNAIKVTDNFSVTTYVYYTSLVNNFMGFNPYFFVSKNLVKTTITDSGGTTVTLNHTYTFDANNRITTEKIIADSGEIVVKTYTYY